MIIAHITNLEELRLLAKIKKEFDINPEIYIDISELATINRSVPLFFKDVVFDFNETRVQLINSEGKNAVSVCFVYNPNNQDIYHNLNVDDILEIKLFDSIKNKDYVFVNQKQTYTVLESEQKN